MLLPLAAVVVARLFNGDGQRRAGIGGIRTDAHGDRALCVAFDHPAGRDEDARRQCQQHRQQQQDAGTAQDGKNPHAPRLMPVRARWQADMMPYSAGASSIFFPVRVHG
jgi:hypothetical protein